MATHLASILMGKHKPSFHKNLDRGDTVVVVNARHLVFTGNKWTQKIYRKHSGYVGGLKEVPAYRWRENCPERVLLRAVRGMIPKTMHKLQQMSRLKVFPENEHPYVHMFPGAPEIPAVKFAGHGAKATSAPERDPNLTDTWNFPADYPKEAIQEIFGSAEYVTEPAPVMPAPPIVQRANERLEEKISEFKRSWQAKTEPAAAAAAAAAAPAPSEGQQK